MLEKGGKFKVDFRLEDGYLRDTNKEGILHLVNDKILGQEDTLQDLLDHMQLVSWIGYMAHRAGRVGYENINFDGREFIVLPSGKKVRIIIKVESYEKYLDHEKYKKERIDEHHAQTG